ncbi:hypothetical protein SAMN05216416_0622 [Streptococcus equinus]|nr:hypothetical protein SAMN05216416_0622 [Streptococcus equinus]
MVEKSVKEEVLSSKSLYRILYFLEFGLVFLVWFLKRYPFSTEIFLFSTSLAIVGGIVIYLYNFIRSGWSVEKILAGIFALAFLVILPMSNYMETSVDDMIMIMLFLLSVSVDKDDKQLLSAMFCLKLIVAISVLLAYNGHFIQDMMMYRADKDMIRHSYGFMHPNSLGMYLISLLFDFSLIKKSYHSVSGLIMLLAALLIFAVTDSRTAFLIASGVILAYFLKPILLKVTIPGYAIIPAVLILFGLGIGLPYFYNADSTLYQVLNHLFTGRLGIGHAYLEQFGLDWLPRNILTFTEINGQPMYDDSFYIDSILRQGILLFSLYPIFLMVELRGKKFTLFHTFLFLITFLINIMEHYGANIGICTILLLNYFAVSGDKLEEKY